MASSRASGYTCLYTGPASSADEAGEVQIVDDLLTKGVAAIAISPSNAPMMANLLKQRAPKIPIMTIDADLGKDDAALRKTYLGTDNYLMGVKFAEYLKKVEAERRHDLPAARQRRGRQHQRPRRRHARHAGRRRRASSG